MELINILKMDLRKKEYYKSSQIIIKYFKKCRIYIFTLLIIYNKLLVMDSIVKVI